jgi:hypothetical protein
MLQNCNGMRNSPRCGAERMVRSTGWKASAGDGQGGGSMTARPSAMWMRHPCSCTARWCGLHNETKFTSSVDPPFAQWCTEVPDTCKSNLGLSQKLIQAALTKRLSAYRISGLVPKQAC